MVPVLAITEPFVVVWASAPVEIVAEFPVCKVPNEIDDAAPVAPIEADAPLPEIAPTIM